MYKFQVIPAHEQASAALRVYENKPDDKKEEATIHGGSFGFLSWAYVTEDVYFPAHRQGAMDCYIYELTQSHLSGDKIEGVSHVHEGDMVIMQSGASNFPVAKRIGPEFTAFEFWFTESGILQGSEQAGFMKINASQFPMKIESDVVSRRLFGDDAPISHINGLKVTELIVPPGSEYLYEVFADRKIGIYIVQGSGIVGNHTYITGDFLKLWQWEDQVDVIVIKTGGEKTSRLIIMDIEDLND